MPTAESKIRSLLRQCEYYGLDGRVRVAALPHCILYSAYNGIGPSWLPDIVRDAYTALHADFEPAALIHDIDFEFGDGTHEAFAAANERFLANCRIIAKAKYAWYDPRRYIRLHQARAMYRLLVLFGWPAYKAARAKHTASVE